MAEQVCLRFSACDTVKFREGLTHRDTGHFYGYCYCAISAINDIGFSLGTTALWRKVFAKVQLQSLFSYTRGCLSLKAERGRRYGRLLALIILFFTHNVCSLQIRRGLSE